NIPVFGKSFHTIAMDQPGFGLSDKPTEYPQYFVHSSSAIVALMDELGIERAHMVGNSVGAGAAVRLALDYPDLAGKLVVLGPGGVSMNVFSPEPTEGVKNLANCSAPPGPSREKLETFLRGMVYDQSVVTDELIDERYESAKT